MCVDFTLWDVCAAIGVVLMCIHGVLAVASWMEWYDND